MQDNSINCFFIWESNPRGFCCMFTQPYQYKQRPRSNPLFNYSYILRNASNMYIGYFSTGFIKEVLIFSNKVLVSCKYFEKSDVKIYKWFYQIFLAPTVLEFSFGLNDSQHATSEETIDPQLQLFLMYSVLCWF